MGSRRNPLLGSPPLKPLKKRDQGKADAKREIVNRLRGDKVMPNQPKSPFIVEQVQDPQTPARGSSRWSGLRRDSERTGNLQRELDLIKQLDRSLIDKEKELLHEMRDIESIEQENGRLTRATKEMASLRFRTAHLQTVLDEQSNIVTQVESLGTGSTARPYPLYSALNHSHPTLVERLKHIDEKIKEHS